MDFSDVDTWLAFLENLESSNGIFEAIKGLIEQKLLLAYQNDVNIDPEQAALDLQKRIDCNKEVIDFVSMKLSE